MSPAPLRLTTSTGLRERRLAQLLQGRSEHEPQLLAVVRDAQILGSLELSGVASSWDEVRAAGRGEPAAEPVERLQRAARVVDAAAPLDRKALLAWHGCLTGGQGTFRSADLARPLPPPPSPAAFVESRLALLEEWVATHSGRALSAPQRGALVLARVIEVLPFEVGNGRVARLAASHAVIAAGGRRPILVGADRERLEASLQAAFRLEMEPLTSLLQEASARSLDVLIQTLEARGPEGAPPPR